MWLMLPVLNFAETLVWLVKIVLVWSLLVGRLRVIVQVAGFVGTTVLMKPEFTAGSWPTPAVDAVRPPPMNAVSM